MTAMLNRLLIAVPLLALLAGCQSLLSGPVTKEVPTALLTKPFTRDALTADLHFMAAQVRAISPLPHGESTEAEVTAALAQATAQLRDGMDRRAFLPIAQEFAGAFRSGHIFVSLPAEDWNLAAAAGERLFDRPLMLRNGSLLMKDGTPIRSINGITAEAIVRWLNASVSTEVPLNRPNIVASRSGELLWIFGLRSPFRIQTAEGHMSLSGVPMQPRDTDAQNREGTTTGHEGNGNFDYRELDGKLAVIRIRHLTPLQNEAWGRFLDDRFRHMAANGLETLVVDLRGNGGGSTELGKRLLEKLADGPVAIASGPGGQYRRSREYDDALAQLVSPWIRWLPWERMVFGADFASNLRLPIGRTYSFGSMKSVDSVRRRESAPSRVYILIDSGTFSSATATARAAQYFKLATLVGAPTADRTTHLGEVAFLRTPSSRLRFAAPAKQFIDINGIATTGPVLPDFLVCGSRDPHFLADSALDVVLAATGGSVESRWRLIELKSQRLDQATLASDRSLCSLPAIDVLPLSEDRS